jgi:hypothetical protein
MVILYPASSPVSVREIPYTRELGALSHPAGGLP